MTENQPVRQRRELDPKLDRVLASINELTPVEQAIHVGVLAGDAALARFGSSGVLVLFVDRGRSADWAPRLEVLRNYAELRRALFASGQRHPCFEPRHRGLHGCRDRSLRRGDRSGSFECRAEVRDVHLPHTNGE